ncbi:MAG: thiolase family protein [Thermaerobacter sp.]|nr:acetyl-CoA C-acyltransferase [Bacillota bacterium]
MREVVIVDGVRTAIGTFGGSLRDAHPSDLGAVVIAEALRRAGVEPERVEDVVMGCVGQIAENAYIARTCAVKAGIPAERNAVSVNRLCSSGLEAVLTAARAIRAGDIDVAVAGGVENMSQLPFYVRRARWGQMRMGHEQLEDGLITMLSDPFGHGHMGLTAERVAEKYGISREDQDQFALRSHQRAVRAIDAGEFAAEIVPVQVPDPRRRGETVTFAVDEHPRRDTSLEQLARLRPVFREGGTVTAGNSAGVNDGAAAVVVMGADTAQRLGLKPRLRLVASAMAGIDPAYMGYAPTYAIPRVLKRAGLTLDDMDVVELNEAFAAQALAVIRDAGLDPERTNPNGGAIALGHPVGATACILVVKVMHYLERHGGRYGMVTMCVGGGQGLAAIFERI